MSAHAADRLLIVIVNYRCAPLTIDCLRSLDAERAQWPAFRVVIADNASCDDSVLRLNSAVKEEGFASWAMVLPLARNGGFAAGNNAALRAALGERDDAPYVLLLNPDTIVRPGALEALVGSLESHPEAGIAGPRLEDLDGTPQRSAFRFPSVLGELENGLRFGLASRLLHRWIVAPPVADAAFQTDWVSGACLLVRRAVLERVGLLDENYFMYYEEVDFCLRARRAGWAVWYVPHAHVVHLVGQSSGVNQPGVPRKRRPGYWFESRRRYFRTHSGRVGAFLADVAWACGFATFRLRQRLQHKPDTDPPNLLGDFLVHNFWRPWCGRLFAKGRVGA